MNITESSILVIFGASGDLTHKKLLPAIFHLFQQDSLPKSFAVLGVSRTSYSDESFRENICRTLSSLEGSELKNLNKLDQFLQLLHYQSLDPSDDSQYPTLVNRLDALEKEKGIEANHLFYLATPPNLYSTIPKSLANHGLNNQEKGWRRVIIEKPFGYDLKSALELNQSLKENYKEHQIYRIDHFLGKETVQNLLVFRFANEFYEPLWNRKYIDFVEITSAEDIGVNKRGGYYDGSGAVRDMVQNHLLQLLAMVAMEPPAKFDAKSVRDETTKVLQTLRPITENFEESVIMGQYTDGRAGNLPLNSYLNEEGVPEDSRTETYSALKVFVDNFRWSEVPFYIRTGKRLPTRVTEVVLHFRKSPWMNKIAHSEGEETAHNKLVIRIQPDEGIKMNFAMKKPGLGFNSQPVSMDFHYSDLKETRISLAYERLLLDAILGDATLYARGDTVEECWKFIDPILDYWNSGKGKVHTYKAGSWGPEAANEMMAKAGHIWRNPCKNFKGEGSHCEL